MLIASASEDRESKAERKQLTAPPVTLKINFALLADQVR
jgi:hypothetical protein